MSTLKSIPLLIVTLLPLAARAEEGRIQLAGPWRLRLDTDDAGLRENWPAAPLVTADRITLPNTTDRAGFGFALDPNTMLHAAPFPATTRFPGVKEPDSGRRTRLSRASAPVRRPRVV